MNPVIFLTVGAQLPFDRLVRAVDIWAGERGRHVVAQIGRSDYQPRHLEWVRFMTPDRFKTTFHGATGIVSHAGMGTILTALQHGKPLLVMPRRADYREHRNDHQLATVRHLAGRSGLHVAADETELANKLDRLEALQAGETIPDRADDRLLAALRQFLRKGA